MKSVKSVEKNLTAHGLAVLAVVRPRAVEAVHRQVVARGARVEHRFRQPWIAREQDPDNRRPDPPVTERTSCPFALSAAPTRLKSAASSDSTFEFWLRELAASVVICTFIPWSTRLTMCCARLGLHAAAHVAEGHQRRAILHHEAGDDGVERPLARRHDVGTLGIERERRTSVVQHEATAPQWRGCRRRRTRCA